MKIRMNPVVVIRLVIMAVLMVMTYVVANPTLLNRVLGVSSWLSHPRVDVSAQRQDSTAVHEAGHLVTSVVLRGARSVDGVFVCATVPSDTEDTLFGRSSTDSFVRDGSRRDALGVAAMLYAGGTAEFVVLGMDSDSDKEDTAMASSLLASYESGTAWIGGYAATREAMKSERAGMTLLRDVNAAGACAKAVVNENRTVIRLLADDILRQPVSLGRHELDANALASFFASHPVTHPPECEF